MVYLSLTDIVNSYKSLSNTDTVSEVARICGYPSSLLQNKVAEGSKLLYICLCSKSVSA
jgi:hypothetical protein